MSLMESLRVAWEALTANKMRSALTMLGIIIGVGSVIAIFAMGRGTEMAVRGELNSIGAGQFMVFAGNAGPSSAAKRVEPITETDMTKLETLLPEVSMVTTAMQIGGQAKYRTETASATVQGVYANYLDFSGDKLAEGRWFTKVEEESAARVVILGQGAVQRLFGENGRPIGKSVSLNGYPFDVIGVREKPTGLLANMAGAMGEGDNNYYVPIAWTRRMTGQDDIFAIQVKVKEGANPTQVMKDTIALLERNHKGAGFIGQSFDQIMDSFSSVMRIITGVLSAVAGISLLVGGVGIMNIMLVSVTERTREIGLRKAIGATYRDVLVQFLIEAVMISLIGGLIGVGLASVPAYFVGRWLKISMLLDWTSIALALGFSVGVGMIFGVYPASKAARLDPIDALRYE